MESFENSSAHVTIITGAHLCRNPRVVKEALSLDRAGFHVTIISPVYDSALLAEDDLLLDGSGVRRVVSIDLRKQGMESFLCRLRRRIGGEITRRANVQVPSALGYALHRTLRMARRSEANYFIGHQEVGAWVCWRLMQEGFAVGADMEDWYSRDLLPEAQAKRPLRLLDRVEGDLVRGGLHCTTTSEAMADAMAGRYGTRPTVIYNAFPLSERDHIDGLRKDRIDDRPSLFWFSQTIGPGRGLERLMRSLNPLERPTQVHLRGNAQREYVQALQAILGPESCHTLHVHPLVHPSELLSRIAEHDIGLALEASEPPSRDLTVTNKILQYLQAGLAVIATPTAGQREVAAKAGKSVTLVDDSENAMTHAIESLLTDPERLMASRRASVEAARTIFSWEVQETRLLGLISSALHRVW